MLVVENPVGSSKPLDQSDGLVSRAELQEQMAELEEKLRKRGEGFESVLQGALSRLDATPLNYHQAVVFFLSSTDKQDAKKRRKAPLLFIPSVLMVLIQCMTVSAAVVGTYLPSCLTNDMCGVGRFCCKECDRTYNRCNYCGFDSPIPMETLGDGRTRNHAPDENFAGFNLTAVSQACTPPFKAMGPTPQQADQPSTFPAQAVEAWCSACVKITGEVDPAYPQSVIKMNTLSMNAFDWATYSIASCVVALIVVGELKDIILVERAVSNASGSGALGKGWYFAFAVLNCLRHWNFCVVLNVIVIMLTATKGGDSISVCLNTVAVSSSARTSRRRRTGIYDGK